MQKKLKIILIFNFFVSFAMIAQSNGIVTDGRVRVRNRPNLSSEIVNVLEKYSLIKIYRYEGTGDVTDHVWDYWACISPDSDEWINAFWISPIPIYYEIIESDESGEFILYRHIDELKESEQGELMFLTRTYSPWEVYYEKDQVYLPSHELGLHHTAARKSFLIRELITSPDLSEIHSDAYKEVSDDGGYAFYKKNGVVIQDDLYYGFPVLREVSIESQDIVLLFGIHVGMNGEDLEDVLGSPNLEDESKKIYQIFPGGSIETIEFYVNEDQISKIRYYMEN